MQSQAFFLIAGFADAPDTSFKTVLVPVSGDWPVKCTQLRLYLASREREGPQKDGPAVPALLEASPLCLRGPTDSKWINCPCLK